MRDRTVRRAMLLALLGCLPACAVTPRHATFVPMPIDPTLVKRLAPTGTLRAGINLGNPILARLDPATGKPSGVSVDLANGFAARLGVPIELVTFDAAGKSVEALTAERVDIGFCAVDPVRGAGLACAPVVQGPVRAMV